MLSKKNSTGRRLKKMSSEYYKKLTQLILVVGICTIIIIPYLGITHGSSPVFFDGYAVYPSHGTSKTTILGMVRPEKRTDNTPLWLYIFWDDLPIRQRVMDTLDGTIHTYMWDVIFTPPQDSSYCKKGTHMITFWVEDKDANIQLGVYTFTIDDTIPDVSWFDDLPQVFIDQITGPVGPQGVSGPQGPAGTDGTAGVQGPIGPTGPQGPQGTMGPNGAPGERGYNGTQGISGEDGVDGKNAPVVLLYAALILSAISTCGVLILFSRRK